jgi:hypothetical protein
MNPFYKYGVVISGAGLLLQLLWIVYFFGVFQGGFREFKERVLSSLARLEKPYFDDVTVVRREQTVSAVEPQRSKR